MRLEVQTPTGPAWIDLDRPSGKPVALLAIGHGAGGGVDARDILAVRDAALTARVAVARITQPYRRPATR
jgi:phosphoribosylcarboxyaminoimidazole (NCAIR) mutase